MARTKVIPVEDLVLDGDTQSRVSISEETVEDYTQVLEATQGDEWPFPPLEVFHDGNQYLVSSGFHRTMAARRNGRDNVPCVVHQGTAWDAFIFGIEANRKNALRPTRDDQRHMVTRLLESGEYQQTQIAEMVGVSLRTVERVSADRHPPLAVSQPSLTSAGSSTSGDPFDVDPEDPFGLATGTPAQPAPATPAEQLKYQKSKTVKLAEAMLRAFDDLQGLKKAPHHEATIKAVGKLLTAAKNWPK